MRAKRLKWLSLLIPLILSLALTDVASNPGTIVSAQSVVDDTLQAPSTFDVSLDISDVENLFSWQVNMSWDPSVLQATGHVFGDFLQGNPNETMEVIPYDDLTEPSYEETKDPSTNTPGAISGWVFPGFAYYDDDRYATCDTPDAEEIYGGYGFSTGSIIEVTKLEVGVKSYNSETNSSERDNLEIEVSNDGGSTWGPIHEVPSSQFELMKWIDVTADFSWTPAMLTNFKVKVRYKQVGVNATTTNLNWIPARVVDTLNVDNPVLSHDSDLNSYASFQYSQRNASFVIGNSTGDPYADSQIIQVDLKVRYEATASAAGDRYRILYYGDSYYWPEPPSKFEAITWTSASSSLATHVWTSGVNLTNPYDPLGTRAWKWADITKLQVEVETERQGGDGAAVFNLYEVWLTVTYLRPTFTTYYLDNTAGYIFLMESTEGEYPLGIYGSGWLANVTFQVLSYGYTVLNIDDPMTLLYNPQYISIPFTAQNGYFSNKLLGDIDGDRDVDADDFYIFAGAYGTSPPSDPRCDLDRDGDVDADDFYIFAGNYGKSI